MCGKVISISRPHDSEVMTQTWKKGFKWRRTRRSGVITTVSSTVKTVMCIGVLETTVQPVLRWDQKKKLSGYLSSFCTVFVCVHVRSYVCMRHERILKGKKNYVFGSVCSIILVVPLYISFCMYLLLYRHMMIVHLWPSQVSLFIIGLEWHLNPPVLDLNKLHRQIEFWSSKKLINRSQSHLGNTSDNLISFQNSSGISFENYPCIMYYIPFYYLRIIPELCTTSHFTVVVACC